MEALQLTKDELTVVKEALEITERVTLSEGAKKAKNPKQVEKFFKGYEKPLAKNPGSHLEVRLINEKELRRLKAENIVKSIATVVILSLVHHNTNVGTSFATGSVSTSSAYKHNNIKLLHKFKCLVKVTLIKSDGTTGKTKVAAVDSGINDFLTLAKKTPAGKKIKA